MSEQQFEDSGVAEEDEGTPAPQPPGDHDAGEDVENPPGFEE
jgi:hypothetical protein